MMIRRSLAHEVVESLSSRDRGTSTVEVNVKAFVQVLTVLCILMWSGGCSSFEHEQYSVPSK